MERKRWMGLAAGVVIILAIVTGVSGFSEPINRMVNPCHDDLAFASPRVDVDFRYESKSVYATLEGKDTLTTDNSVSVFVTVTDEETNRTDRVTWAHANGSGTSSFPLESGAVLHVSDQNIALNLTHGDELTIVWKGYERQPGYCPRDSEARPFAEAIGRYVV